MFSGIIEMVTDHYAQYLTGILSIVQIQKAIALNIAFSTNSAIDQLELKPLTSWFSYYIV